MCGERSRRSEFRGGRKEMVRKQGRQSLEGLVGNAAQRSLKATWWKVTLDGISKLLQALGRGPSGRSRSSRSLGSTQPTDLGVEGRGQPWGQASREAQRSQDLGTRQ